MSITTGIIFGLLAMFAWGVADFYVKKVVGKIGYKKTFIFAYSIGTLPLIIYFMFAPQQVAFSSGIWMVFLVAALFNIGAYLAFYKGLEKGMISIISPIVACNPIIIIVLSMVILKEILKLNHWGGLLLAVIGLVLVSFKNSKAKHETISGIKYAFAALFLWGTSIFGLGYLVKKTQWFIAIVVYRVLTVIFGVGILKSMNASFKLPKKEILYVLLVIGLLDAVGVVFFSLGISLGFVSVVGTISALFPAVTVVLARIFLREKLLFKQKIGIVSILLGLVLLTI